MAYGSSSGSLESGSTSTTPEDRSASSDGHVQVAIRLRPLLDFEASRGHKRCLRVGGDGRSVGVAGESGGFTFDKVLDESASQQQVYDSVARGLVASCLQGYNATVLAYGQTGSGKTHTMTGEPECPRDRGVVPRAAEQIFAHIAEHTSPNRRFLVRVSYLQIYNDVIYDLLDRNGTNLAIREDPGPGGSKAASKAADRDGMAGKARARGVFVEGLKEFPVTSPAQLFDYQDEGDANRATSKTRLNEQSSRSHAVMRIVIEQADFRPVDSRPVSVGGERKDGDGEFEDDFDDSSEGGGGGRAGEGGRSAEGGGRRVQRVRVSKLNLVDLAGSERVRASGATGRRLEETRTINRSLSALGNVIAALTGQSDKADRADLSAGDAAVPPTLTPTPTPPRAGPGRHIPYRDSKLTRILEDSLGGNCRTAMVATVSPSSSAVAETMSTLKFANRAKNIRNRALVNEDLDKTSVIRRLGQTNRHLRRLLAKGSSASEANEQVLHSALTDVLSENKVLKEECQSAKRALANAALKVRESEIRPKAQTSGYWSEGGAEDQGQSDGDGDGDGDGDQELGPPARLGEVEEEEEEEVGDGLDRMPRGDLEGHVQVQRGEMLLQVRRLEARDRTILRLNQEAKMRKHDLAEEKRRTAKLSQDLMGMAKYVEVYSSWKRKHDKEKDEVEVLRMKMGAESEAMGKIVNQLSILAQEAQGQVALLAAGRPGRPLPAAGVDALAAIEELLRNVADALPPQGEPTKP